MSLRVVVTRLGGWQFAAKQWDGSGLCVRDVESSSRSYQRLLGCESGHGGIEYERLNSHGHKLALDVDRGHMSYESRTGAVLFAQNLDRVATFYSAVLGLAESNRDDDHILLESPGFQLVVHRITNGGSVAGDITASPARRAMAAFKPVFFVPSISRLRVVAETHGGVMEPADREWSFNGVTVCDGLDPEGNVIQFREHAG